MDREDLSFSNAVFLEDMYGQWTEDPSSVDAEWREFFASRETRREPSVPSRTQDRPQADPASAAYKQGRVNSLLWAYREIGYLYADLNPLIGYQTPDLKYLLKTIEGSYAGLDLKHYDLSEDDLDREFSIGKMERRRMVPLREIVDSARETYCSYMGVEILHIQNKSMRSWLIDRIEQDNNRPKLTAGQQRTIQQDLIRAEEFEHYLQSHFIGQKRFSLEGGEALIPALHYLVDTVAADVGVQEVVLGMTHRGRLNVLNNVLDKPADEIFAAFEDRIDPHQFGGSGDVKYHLGFSTDHVNEDGSSIHISLVANPSHLEAVDGVVEGKARGVQRRRGDTHRKKVIPVLIHGDAAFTGQGVVLETFNLSQLRGYKTGGTIHIIVNNQIGFTTASRDARSTFFPTDVAKTMPVPIFHVNGDRPEYVVRAIDLAIRFRQKFGYDVVIDIFCYRKWGHNEGDDPSFTHPIMYGRIKENPGVAAIYGKTLAETGVYGETEQNGFRLGYREGLNAALEAGRNNPRAYTSDAFQYGEWKGYTKEYDHAPTDTSVPSARLKRVANHLTATPEGFLMNPKLARIVEARKEAFESGHGIDWAFAESLAFGTLVLEGIAIRLSGEDSGRGTFSQRHAVWWNTASEQPEPYIPLSNVAADQARFSVYDSPLSEYAVLAFEYGNALTQPEMLTLWEAQFGDFVNGAQVIIDQFIAAGESKWNRGNGLVLLLPHGYEGQGPEHSSGHLERFLQLCAEDNIQVCNPTTPSQYFHLLRRQVKRSFRKPLIVMTPKSLLRHKLAISAVGELESGTFSEVLDDPGRPKKVSRVILCSGKIYYDLVQRREEAKNADTAVIRVEQFYPVPETQLRNVLGTYSSVKELLWVQEEPRNRGGWTFMRGVFDDSFPEYTPRYVGRKASASPATGSHRQHVDELDAILTEAIGKKDGA